MFAILRRCFALMLCTAALLLVAGSAIAQIECGACDPYSSHCSDICYHCRPGEDPGMCQNAPQYSTCGNDRWLGGNCLQSGCTTNFQEIDRVVVGTYGQSNWTVIYIGGEWSIKWQCEHHHVDRVTQHDMNQCNLNAYWWDRQFCDDVMDFQSGWFDSQPECCNPLTCNDWHSCF